MRNRKNNPKTSILSGNEVNQNSRTKKAFSSYPISLRMAGSIAEIDYNSVCWRTWELYIKQEIIFVGYRVCPLTKRMVKFYTTNNSFTNKPTTHE